MQVLSVFITLTFLFTGSVFAQKAAQAAKADLQARQKQKIKGEVTFLKTDKGTKIIANVTGLEPGSVHGFHIHEKGVCDAPDFKTAGGHFNPQKMAHGEPGAEFHHAGDLGNLVADKTGAAKKELLLSAVQLEGETSIIGKGVIVHLKPDDLRSQPTGDAGDRIACGVIRATDSAPRHLEKK